MTGDLPKLKDAEDFFISELKETYLLLNTAEKIKILDAFRKSVSFLVKENAAAYQEEINDIEVELKTCESCEIARDINKFKPLKEDFMCRIHRQHIQEAYAARDAVLELAGLRVEDLK